MYVLSIKFGIAEASYRVILLGNVINALLFDASN